MNIITIVKMISTGAVIHIISYTVVPIVIGIIGIVAYCLGIKVF